MKKQGNLSLLLAIVMMLGMVPSVLADVTPIQPTNGYYWLEGENSTSMRGFVKRNVTDTNSSGNDVAKLSTTGNPGAEGYYVDFSIDVKENETYDIWLRGTKTGNSFMSQACLLVDGDTASIEYVSGDDWAGNINYGWSKAQLNLAEGIHTLRYVIYDPCTGDNVTYQGGLDVICVVPSIYGWTQSITDKPVMPTIFNFTNGYFWAEAEDATKSTTFIENTHEEYSNGTALRIRNNNGVLGTTRYSFTYIIDVPTTANYDISINGSASDNEWQSPTKVGIDGTEYVTTTKTFHSTWDGDNQLGWNTTAANLTAGKHRIEVYINSGTSQNASLYRFVFDAICISPADWDWVQSISVRPQEPTKITKAWLEDTDANSVHASFGSPRAANNVSGMLTVINTPSSPTGDKGYNIDYNMYMAETDEYDVYVHGSVANEWMSPVNIFVGDTKYNVTKLIDEEWPNSSWNEGWSKATVTMSEGKNILSVAFVDSRTASTPQWIGCLDCIVVVPEGASFTPVRNSINASKADYKLGSVLDGIDLEDVRDNITLPSSTATGETITWSSDNTSVITNDGTITRTREGSGTANLTATITIDTTPYSKTFAVTVARLVDFDVTSFVNSGTLTAGGTISASATLKYNPETLEQPTKKAMLIVALYDVNNGTDELISSDIDIQNIGSTPITLSSSIILPSDLSANAYARCFLWNDINDLRPIENCIPYSR